MEKKMGNIDEREGTPTPLPDRVQILKSAIPRVFDSVRSRFTSMGTSEETVNELTALIDIDFRLRYWSHEYYEHNKNVVLGDLAAGKSAQAVHHALYNSINPNLKIQDSRFRNHYHNQTA